MTREFIGTQEIPTKRWQQAIDQGKAKLRPLEPSVDLRRSSPSISEKSKERWKHHVYGKEMVHRIPERNPDHSLFIPNVKFMLCKED